MTKEITNFKTELSLASFIDKNYKNQIANYFADNQKALEFLSNVRAEVQRNPTLLECEPGSLVNSFITMASLKLMPSGVSGEAYVLPYNKGNSGKIAQFQLGYQGLVTLFYRAGVQAIYADIVREGDEISLENGSIKHKVDPKKSMKERGPAVGAYVVINFKGQLMGKYMHADDILAHGKKFSKSFATDYSPWNEKNDPELWMWKKTALKQAAKLVPKNETIVKAIAADNEDSIIGDRLAAAKEDGKTLAMGNFIKNNEDENQTKENKTETKQDTENNQGEAK